MALQKFYAKFSVNGRSGGEIIVEARDTSAARRMAEAQLKSNVAYAGQKVYVGPVGKIR